MNSAEEIRYTYNDYIKWDDEARYELIEGIPYMMASPSRLHQKVSGKIFGQFFTFLKNKTCEVYHAPFDVRLNANSFDDIIVQPDIFIVCDESKHDGQSVKGAPDLIIEILSPGNTRHDTNIKFRLYQKAGVREYWIVDPYSKTVQVYILKNGKYGTGKIYMDEDTVPVHTLKNCQIELSDIFFDAAESNGDKLISSQKIIEAFKKAGVNNELIEKVFEELNDSN